jgi:pentapeptide MXKDX repeat protein
MSSCWLQRIRDDTGATQEDNLKEDSLKEDSLKEDSLKEDSLKEDSLKEDSLKEDCLKGDCLKEASLTLPRKVLIYPRLLKALIGGDMEEPISLGYNVCLLHGFYNHYPSKCNKIRKSVFRATRGSCLHR